MICSNHYRSTSYRTNKGFTLIELMIAIAIVAILVAIAVPAYTDYTIRAKVAECINGAAVAKVGISEYRQSLGAWPPTLEEAGLNVTGDSQYCNGMTNYDPSVGSFAMDVDELAVDPIVGTIEPVLTPVELPSGFIDWACSKGVTPITDLKYLPSTCRSS